MENHRISERVKDAETAHLKALGQLGKAEQVCINAAQALEAAYATTSDALKATQLASTSQWEYSVVVG